jgi:hypothetical protein
MRRRSRSIGKIQVRQAALAPRVWPIRILNAVAGIAILGQAWVVREDMLPAYIAAVAAAGLIGLLNLRGRSG